MLWLGLVAVATLSSLASCAGQRFETLFTERLGKEALACLHPAGEFQSAGEVEVEGSDAFRGTIYWKGGATENNYFTKVRVKVADGQATVYVVEDTSILPALNQDCRFPVEPN
jgi:hypothetical protein